MEPAPPPGLRPPPATRRRKDAAPAATPVDHGEDNIPPRYWGLKRGIGPLGEIFMEIKNPACGWKKAQVDKNVRDALHRL